MAQMVVLRESEKSAKLSERERLLLLEVGRDEIYSASIFVEYFSDAYSMAKSTVWYNLHKLKSKEMLDFASKEEIGKPMKLTRKGLCELMKMRSSPEQNLAVARNVPSDRQSALGKASYYAGMLGQRYAYGLGQE